MNIIMEVKAARSRRKSVISKLLFRYVFILFYFCSLVKQRNGIYDVLRRDTLRNQPVKQTDRTGQTNLLPRGGWHNLLESKLAVWAVVFCRSMPMLHLTC
ncbi:hypothetical protein QO002_002446 [Pararhizobium capsulatum DSM 1112]|uniref:Transposase n=1 Tax=Pararhizobium capsulatum DSM 1112 TaxID=1121113 RepID=A0ABU0BPY1_9HYPH|nr:hypothetical protein [Pararhizobium capsulatum]MDQ0320308.1 hypothetical protein [Pararhizobium capsulatum DSM 1112]